MRLFEGTEFDRPPQCDVCGELEEVCTCPPPEKEYLSPEKQTAKLAIEKRKKGKMVTIVRGLSPDETDLPELLVKLKNTCGAGGTLKEEELEIQGKHLDRVRDVLTTLGYRVKG